ncbi:hypothetical protein [Sorangium sp. So ce131]|uniref:hypothetical protein n=1 Tax=Sorangium sp. So ce131 TaxID=3133282 RepID=UPI003F621065
MRMTPAFGFIAAALAAACGSSTADPDPSETFCVPGSTTSCTCHAVSGPGTATCLPDGSAYGPCQEEGGGECACPLGRSDSCCPGDGICCPCVLGCDEDKIFSQDPATDALIACACAAGVCAEECEVECAGEGISARCAPCVEQAGMDQCKAELEACSGS